MNSTPLRAIRNSDVETLHRDGVVFLPGMFDREWIRRMSGALDRVEARYRRLERVATHTERDVRRDIFFTLSYRWTHDPDFAAFAFESPLSLLARNLMQCQERLGLFLDQVFIQKRRAVPSHWHHARSAVPLTGRQFLNIWVPFDPVPAGRGSLGFVIGSHRWDRWFMAAGHHLLPRKDRRFGENNRYKAEDIPPIDENPDRYPVVTWDFQPGDAVAFGMNVVHKATGDPTTTIHRRAITTRWWGDDIVYDHRPRQLGPILRAGLRTGDRLDGCDLFPLVWTRSAGRWRRRTAWRYDPSPLLAGPVYHDERY